ncbi:hypothetical protein FOXYSP1_09659 [Fusarium oxysporum f. sp. phaseoli]
MTSNAIANFFQLILSHKSVQRKGCPNLGNLHCHRLDSDVTALLGFAMRLLQNVEEWGICSHSSLKLRKFLYSQSRPEMGKVLHVECITSFSRIVE